MDSAGKKKILVLVEGEKADVAVMKRLFELYPELDAKYQIVSYKTNIYVLYQDFFAGEDIQENLDLLQVLRSREPSVEAKRIFDDRYTDILLVFDLDPQDPLFTEEKVRKMQGYFRESSDMGKLYLNYPMIESFYHMPEIPDPEYQNRIVLLEELRQGTYKERVRKESRGNDYRKYITCRADSNYVITENLRKARKLLCEESCLVSEWKAVDLKAVLDQQLNLLRYKYLQVLCTCALYIYDYNSSLLQKD
jgi:hypothetical protein